MDEKLGTPTPDSTPKPNLQPNRLDFSTPTTSIRKRRMKIATPVTPSMPDTNRMSDIESLDASSKAGSSVSSMTPDLAKLSLGRGRGRPRKEVVKLTMEDSPLDGTKEEQKKYIARKRTKLWRYNKLMGCDSAEYREKELKCVKSYQRKRKIDEKDSEEMSTDSQSEHKKELS